MLSGRASLISATSEFAKKKCGLDICYIYLEKERRKHEGKEL
jgi:hypothetical protein